MLRGRPALASVFLCFVCLPILTLRPVLKPCSQDSTTQVKSLIDALELKALDCKLYTPTIKDFENCPISTLRCFASEVTVLIEELNTVTELQIRLNLDKILISLAMRFNQIVTQFCENLSQLDIESESQCLQCERHKEEKVERFLTKLHTTLEQMNSKHC